MMDNPFLKFARLTEDPFWPQIEARDIIRDEETVATALSIIFKRASDKFGEEKVRALFAPYGRALNNMDRTSRKNAGLIWKLYSMDKPSVSGLARQLAGTGEDCEDEFEAWRKQIHRALNDKDALRIVSDDSMTYLGYSILPGSLIQSFEDPRFTGEMWEEYKSRLAKGES